MAEGGNTIFNGRVDKLELFFKNHGIKFGKYTNPADVLLRLANDPRSLDNNLSIKTLTYDL